MEVPFPLAASSRLISFLTFQISIFFSASLAWGALMVAVSLLVAQMARCGGSPVEAVIEERR